MRPGSTGITRDDASTEWPAGSAHPATTVSRHTAMTRRMPADPADQTGPTRPTTTTDPANPTEPASPTGVTEPASPTGPTGVTGVTEPASPTGPTGVTEPAGPAEPATSTDQRDTTVAADPAAITPPHTATTRRAPANLATGTDPPQNPAQASGSDTRLRSHQPVAKRQRQWTSRHSAYVMGAIGLAIAGFALRSLFPSAPSGPGVAAATGISVEVNAMALSLSRSEHAISSCRSRPQGTQLPCITSADAAIATTLRIFAHDLASTAVPSKVRQALTRLETTVHRFTSDLDVLASAPTAQTYAAIANQNGMAPLGADMARQAGTLVTELRAH